MENVKKLIGQRVNGEMTKWIRKVGGGYGFAKVKCENHDIIVVHSSEIRNDDVDRVISEPNVSV